MSNADDYAKNAKLSYIRLDALLALPGAPEKRKGRWRIYALVDPTDDTIRYVGATRHPKLRLIEHCKAIEGLKGTWVQRLAVLGLKPRMVMLSRSTNNSWEYDEIAWTKFRVSDDTIGGSMNRGAERLRELFPDRGGVMRLAGEMRVLWSVASRWRSGERAPIAKFRVILLERYDIPLGDWDVIVVVTMPEPIAEPVVLSEPEPVPVVPEPPRQFRSLLFRREPVHAQK